MQTTSQLKHRAIKAAKCNDWKAAVDCNQHILKEKPEDIAALNRLGVAYIQLKKRGLAKKAFTTALKIDRTNAIAQKQLERLKQKTTEEAPTFINQSFIEEPGKTKVVELHRLAGKQVLESLSPGQNCELKPKNRYISVNKGKEYIGALPEDVSYRLSKLIATGNTYECRVQSANCRHCFVFIEETSRSEKNAHVNSFPTSKQAADTSDADEKLLLGENIPLQIVKTDGDVEKTLDDIPRDSLK